MAGALNVRTRHGYRVWKLIACLSTYALPPYPCRIPVLPLLDMVPTKKEQKVEVWVW